jgi:nucleoside-diphosphate-sugar epimerase
MKVLITGAAGKVGRAVCRELAEKHELRLFDLMPVREPAGEMILGSVTDGAALWRATVGVDAVVHLAFGHPGIAMPGDPDELSYDVNVKGTHQVLRAAHAAEVRRVVYASSLSVYDGLWVERRAMPPAVPTPIAEDHPVCFRSVYGLTKYLGEEVCRYYARQHGLSVVILRLSGVTTPEDWERSRQHGWWRWEEGRTSTADVGRAFRLALEVEGLDYDLFHIASTHPQCPWDISHARAVLGYEPQDVFGTEERRAGES